MSLADRQPQGVDQALPSLRHGDIEAGRRGGADRLLKFLLGACHLQAGHVSKSAHCSKLVIIAMFPKARLARHQDKRLAVLRRRNDDAHAGMRHYHRTSRNMRIEIARRHERNRSDCARNEALIGSLGDNLKPAPRRDIIERNHQAGESELRSGGGKDHRTDPA